MTTQQMIELLSSMSEYVKLTYPEGRIKDNLLNNLENSVFWATYIEE